MRKNILRDCLRIAREKNRPDLHPEWGRNHHFSFVVQGGKVLEWGMNRDGVVPPQYAPWSRVHSEVDAWRKAKGLLDPTVPFSLINIRLNKHGGMMISKPCPCCQAFLGSLGCKDVYFTTEAGFASMLIYPTS